MSFQGLQAKYRRLFANAHLLLNKLRFAAELKNKNIRFLQAVSNYAKLSI